MRGRGTCWGIGITVAAVLAGCASPGAGARVDAVRGSAGPAALGATPRDGRPAARGSAVGPSVLVLEREIDLGTHTDLDAPGGAVVFRNMGDATLELRGPFVPGAHGAESEPVRIEPLGTRAVEFTMDLWGLGRGVHERSITWHTNDPRQRTVTVRLAVCVRPIIDVQVRPVPVGE